MKKILLTSLLFSVLILPLMAQSGPHFEEIKAIILEEKVIETEGARDLVTKADLPALIDLYWELEGETVKQNTLLLVIVDYLDPDLKPVYKDWLSKGLDTREDMVRETYGVGICLFEGSYDKWMDYYDDPGLCAKTAAYWAQQEPDPADE